jgi:hypothetical protein
LTLDRLCNLFVQIVRENGDERTMDILDEALAPPNRINPATGLPFGWEEDDELDSLADITRR